MNIISDICENFKIKYKDDFIVHLYRQSENKYTSIHEISDLLYMLDILVIIHVNLEGDAIAYYNNMLGIPFDKIKRLTQVHISRRIITVNKKVTNSHRYRTCEYIIPALSNIIIINDNMANTITDWSIMLI